MIAGKLLANDYSLRAANVREREVYRNNLTTLLSELAKQFQPARFPDVGWTTPAGGFFLTLSVPFPVDGSVLARCADRHRVLWTPLGQFYGDGVARNEIRLSYSHLSQDELHEGVVRLAAFVAEQAGRA